MPYIHWFPIIPNQHQSSHSPLCTTLHHLLFTMKAALQIYKILNRDGAVCYIIWLVIRLLKNRFLYQIDLLSTKIRWKYCNFRYLFLTLFFNFPKKNMFSLWLNCLVNRSLSYFCSILQTQMAAFFQRCFSIQLL